MTTKRINEIKKELENKKSKAFCYKEDEKFKYYRTYLSVDINDKVLFNVPISEMGENKFEEKIEAILLIKWLQ